MEVGAFEAKTHLTALLDRVEKGERITITRHGVPVALLVPVMSEPRVTRAGHPGAEEVPEGETARE